VPTLADRAPLKNKTGHGAIRGRSFDEISAAAVAAGKTVSWF
jgi:hypothetical protein